MSSIIHPATASHVLSRQPILSNIVAAAPGPSIPSGTFVPGTKVQVGGHRVVIEKYLSEGGFAHVYLVRLPKPIDGENEAVLKRVAVPDKEALVSMRTEVETMKKLKGHRHIVTYIDSHASQLKGGGYEVFLLMEYCAGGGLIDFMNTRLQNRLTEPEILKIFSDVAQGVACMHYLKPPLLHRDLKVENILISSSSTSRRYKLCDFGSTAPPRPAAKSAAEGRLIEDDVQKHTTLQYRSPEMIDVYRKQPIDEKSDIWALGVLLYKLCYYTTPFEEQGQMAILNASFKFPGYPSFTDRTKKLIASMLRENPQSRPNIYQAVREVCLMRGTDIPIKDIYAGRTASEARRNQTLPSPPSNTASPAMVGAFTALPTEEKITIPEITPMRRGRPGKVTDGNGAPRTNPSPMRAAGSDPFAALDSTPGSMPASTSIDEVSSRFPPLDQFSILHDSGNKFAFDPKASLASGQTKDINQRVTEALADDAFAQPLSTKKEPQIYSKSNSIPANVISTPKPNLGAPSSVKASRASTAQQPTPPRPNMVSIGTMTSPSPPLINRFPSPVDQRSSSQTRASAYPKYTTSSLGVEFPSSQRPVSPDQRSHSQTTTLSSLRASASSRPSLEGQRPSALDLDSTLSRSKSVASRARPTSAYMGSSTKLAGDCDHSNSWTMGHITSAVTGNLDDGGEPTKIQSNVEFLKVMEEEDPAKRKIKRSSSGSKHIKRASMPSISLSSTKSLLAGRFGDAFRKFETNTAESNPHESSPPLYQGGSELTPIAGSEATDGRSDDGQVIEETEEVPPEVRRELERRRLSLEERRVATAAAAYKQSVAERGGPGKSGHDRGRFRGDGNRATSIQNKVQALLEENGKSSPTKTAAGYGRFTHSPGPVQAVQDSRVEGAAVVNRTASPDVLNGPALAPAENLQRRSAAPSVGRTLHRPVVGASNPPNDRPQARPNAPPKPQALRTGGRGEQVLPAPSTLGPQEPVPGGVDEWESNFSKRYPSLSGLEMVETEIETAVPGGITVRDV